jgi:aminopeptidase N
MKDATPKTIYLQDYQVPAYLISNVELSFSLDEDYTLVTSITDYTKNADSNADNTLVLHGEELELVGLRLNGDDVAEENYHLTASTLTLNNLPDQFTLEVDTRIYPQKNTSLEGLYKSSGNFCTQCEAQGFRKITYYLDRPDVLAVFTTRIVADKANYPVLLSNGNLEASGEFDDGRHWVKWHDPHQKPAYLFALVAGNLEHVEDSYTTTSGRDVKLQIFTEAHNIDKCDHAMGSLKRAMQWDEQRFGLEYDLDIYMVVAVDDFNMGAMENKGLNVFNSKLVFASPETATDFNYVSIEAVIGHEYFHNWTGNRVTCRDWFQLSLKEGLTVFRDQEFTADLHSRTVKRIEDVRMLRTHQFTEDASPMAHPIRPSSFVEINNFYTVTVYEKGAEVVRLYNTLLGQDGFRKGMDLYFERHDGQAVTTEDFLAAMADANETDLSQMQVWYDQAGTPLVKVDMMYDEQAQSCTFTFKQSHPGFEESKPYLIPIKMGLLDKEGNDYPLTELDNNLLLLTEAEQSITFNHITSKPVPSLLRNFSAPVKLEYNYSNEDYAFLMQHDSDGFNRWDASQQLAMKTIQGMLKAHANNEAYGLEPSFIEAFQAVLTDDSLDNALKAEALALPSETDIAEISKPANPQAIFEIREFIQRTLANTLRIDFENWYEQSNHYGDYVVEATHIGRRSLQNICLHYLSYIDDESMPQLIYQQYENANNMTDQIAALNTLSHMTCTERETALADFEKRWQDDALVMDKWFTAQATSKRFDALEQVKSLMKHPAFTLKNPNRVRSLVSSFAAMNPSKFHDESGEGYAFIADQVITLDALNPQIASRLVRTLMNWKHYEPVRADLMKKQLERIAARESLSNDVAEIVNRSLG